MEGKNVNKEIADYVKDSSDEINKLRIHNDERKLDLLKHITTILVAILTVLVSFKTNNELSNISQLLFLLTLSLIGVSVVSGIFYIHKTVDELNQLIVFREECLKKRLGGDLTTIMKHEVEIRKYFVYSMYIFYFSSIFSIISLVAYGFTV